MARPKVRGKVAVTSNIGGGTFYGLPVGIVVPYYGQQQKLTRLIGSIMQHTKGNPFRIQVVNDGTPEGEAPLGDEMATLRFVGWLNMPENSGFGAAVNAGVEALATEIKWLVVMHSDVVVTSHHWLTYLGETMQATKHQGVKMVGARADNPGPDVHPSLRSPSMEPFGETTVLEDDSLPLYCTLFHRDLFRHLGGGLKEYPYHGFEEDELGYRVRHYGFRQAVCGRAWVRHEGGGTVRAITANNTKIQKAIALNRELCIADIKALIGRVPRKDRVVVDPRARPKKTKTEFEIMAGEIPADLDDFKDVPPQLDDFK
jgi:GT2 family glycosyltransferase